jgi:uncharacterized delta-60 repeat protein
MLSHYTQPMKKILLLLSILTTLFNNGVFAQAGILDNSYGTNGKVSTEVAPGGGEVWGMAMQDDWSVVVGGFAYNGTDSDFVLMRYKLNGDIDSTFGVNGQVITQMSSGNDVIYSVAIRSDGKIMAGGLAWNGTNYDFACARYNSNGSLDTTFAGTGKVITPMSSGNDKGFSLSIQSDWSVVLGGTAFNGTNNDFALVRYTANGTLDNTFGTNGKVLTPMGIGNDKISSLIIQSDGKILVAGMAMNGSQSHYALARYNSDGTLDTGFGTSGKVLTAVGTADDDWAYSLAITPDEKIVVGGYAGNGTTDQFSIVRYLKNGNLDNTFGASGRVLTAVGDSDASIYGIIVQPDGKIVGAGSYFNGSHISSAIARYNVNGTADSSFGFNGQATTPLSSGENQSYSAVMQPDGKIITAGYSSNGGSRQFAVARYISGLTLGLIDFSLNNNSVLIYPNPVAQNATLEYTLSKEEVVSIRLLDMQGKVVETFISNQTQSVGNHKQPLLLPDGLASGSYVINIASANGSMNIKIVK